MLRALIWNLEGPVVFWLAQYCAGWLGSPPVFHDFSSYAKNFLVFISKVSISLLAWLSINCKIPQKSLQIFQASEITIAHTFVTRKTFFSVWPKTSMAPGATRTAGKEVILHRLLLPECVQVSDLVEMIVPIVPLCPWSRLGEIKNWANTLSLSSLKISRVCNRFKRGMKSHEDPKQNWKFTRTCPIKPSGMHMSDTRAPSHKMLGWISETSRTALAKNVSFFSNSCLLHKSPEIGGLNLFA